MKKPSISEVRTKLHQLVQKSILKHGVFLERCTGNFSDAGGCCCLLGAVAYSYKGRTTTDDAVMKLLNITNEEVWMLESGFEDYGCRSLNFREIDLYDLGREMAETYA